MSPGYGNSMGAISFCGRTTVSRDTNSDNLIKKKEEVAMSTKLICTVTRCGWKGIYNDVLSAPSPFDDKELWACPRCKTVESFRSACDEPDCWKAVECGTPTPEGYRSTCSEHAPQPLVFRKGDDYVKI